MVEYQVSVSNISHHPVVSPSGALTHTVVFHIESPQFNLSEDWDGGTVEGDTMNRCFRLQEKVSVSVSQPLGWKDQRPEAWQATIVDLALDHLVSESA